MAKKKKAARKIITAADKRKAAMVLAYAGYKKGKRAPRGSIAAAARQAKVSCQTIDKWTKDPDFYEAIEEIAAEIISESVTNLRQSSRKGNVTAAIFLLKILDERWDDGLRNVRERHKLELERQRLANEGIKDAVKSIPQTIINVPSGVPEAPPELLPFLEKIDEASG